MQVGNTISTPALAQMLQSQAGLEGAQAMFGTEGGFAMVLQQMTQSGEGMDMFGDLLAQLQQTEEDAEQEGTDLAALMMAELMSGGSMLFPTKLAAQNTALEAFATSGSAGVQQQLLALLQGEPSSKVLTPEQLKQLVQTMSVQQGESTEDAVVKPNLTVLSNVQASDSSDADALLGQKNFLNSIAEAKKMLMEQSGAKKQEPETTVLNVEQLQQQVDTSRNHTAPIKMSEQDLDAQAVMEQIKTGLKTQIAQGKSEFEVCIKPEGLGKITVKLMESGDKMTLSLVASSPQVAKLLNNSLADLQAAMRPYHVEVHEAVSQNQNAQQADISGQAFADQQQKQQQYEEQARHAQSHSYRDDVNDFDDILLEDVPSTERHRYI